MDYFGSLKIQNTFIIILKVLNMILQLITKQQTPQSLKQVIFFDTMGLQQHRNQ